MRRTASVACGPTGSRPRTHASRPRGRQPLRDLLDHLRGRSAGAGMPEARKPFSIILPLHAALDGVGKMPGTVCSAGFAWFPGRGAAREPAGGAGGRPMRRLLGSCLGRCREGAHVGTRRPCLDEGRRSPRRCSPPLFFQRRLSTAAAGPYGCQSALDTFTLVRVSNWDRRYRLPPVSVERAERHKVRSRGAGLATPNVREGQSRRSRLLVSDVRSPINSGHTGSGHEGPLVWGSSCQAHFPSCCGAVAAGRIGIGLAASCAALGRTTLYPVGPRRVPDQHPTCVGDARPGGRDPSF
jgi:hypothetical protein